MNTIKLDYSTQIAPAKKITNLFYNQDGSKANNQQFSDSFRLIMHKVMNKIYFKHTWVEKSANQETSSLNKLNRSLNQTIDGKNIVFKEGLFQTHSLIRKKFSSSYDQTNKLKIKGIGRPENESNLLNKNSCLKVYNKTSVSFLNNKQHRKSIQHKRAKSLSSQIQCSSFLQKIQLSQNKFYGSRFFNKQCPKKITVSQSLTKKSYMPSIILQHDYEKMYGLFKQMEEPKHKKMVLNKKIYNKKMKQRQKYIRKENSRQNKKHTMNKKASYKNYFQPWNQNDNEFNDEVFSNSKLCH